MSPFQQYPTSSSNKRQRPDASPSQHSTEESFKRLRLTSNKRERPQEEGVHSNEDALQSFKRLRVNDNSTLSNDPQQEQDQLQHTNTQQAGQATSSNEVPNNYTAMNRFLGKLHLERRLQHDRHAESHLPFDSKLY
jgi:hypothetical protein